MEDCERWRRDAEQLEFISDCDRSLFWKKEKAIHLGIQLIASEQVKDENLKEMYLHLTRGMMSLKSMVKPLQVVSFFQYYQHLGKLITRYSIQNKKHYICFNIS